LDKNCSVNGVGGVHALYIVEQCQGSIQLFAASRDAKHLWTTPAFHVPTGGNPVVVDKDDTVVVSTDGRSDTFDAATGKPRR
jgi:hypothetical protein